MGKPSRKRRSPTATHAKTQTHSLVPHSREWFARMAEIDPMRAALTRAVVDGATYPDVCGMCGRPGARLFDQTTRPWLPWLLCPDCLAFRTLLGERFQARRLSHPGS
jgi:hypothetical protein